MPIPYADVFNVNISRSCSNRYESMFSSVAAALQAGGAYGMVAEREWALCCRCFVLPAKTLFHHN
jgi:hypothetical protein